MDDAKPAVPVLPPSCFVLALWFMCSLNFWNKPHSMTQCAAIGSARAASAPAGSACSGPPSFDTNKGVATLAPPTATRLGNPHVAASLMVNP